MYISPEDVEIPEELKPEGENILLTEGVSDGRISDTDILLRIKIYQARKGLTK